MYQKYDLLTIQRRFPTELACRKYLEKQRWPKGFYCVRCASSEVSYIRTRHLYQCRGCRSQVSLTAGTIFHKTRIPLRKWFWLILLMGHNKHGVSMLEIQRLLSIGSYQTVWTMCHKVRTAMAQRDGRYKLNGIIELDDAIFGRKTEGHKTHRRPKTVRVAVSTDSKGCPGFTRMQVTDYAGVLHAQAMARKTISRGQTIRTDGGSSFPALKELGFRHERHPKLTPEQMDIFLPWVHTVISNAKRFLMGTHHLEDPKHLQRFLDEFSYRFNRRNFKGQLFDRLLSACTTTGSIRYADLIG